MRCRLFHPPSPAIRPAIFRARAPALALALGLAFFAAPGCGGNSSSGVTSAGSAATNTSTGTQTAVPSSDSGQTQTVPGEPPAPYGAGSTAPQSVGELVDGLQLSDIRWSDHGSYFRVVFEMGNPGGVMTQVPHADASMTADHKQVRVVLGGIRSLGGSANVTAKSLSVGDSVVTAITRVPSGDDQAMIYNIDLSKATTYSLSGLSSPGRIVVDITK